MSYADELRNKSESYDPEQIRLEAIEKYVNGCIDLGIKLIKNQCEMRAAQGKNGISGYLSIDEETEYGTGTLEGVFYEDRPELGWRKHAEKAPNCDFGMRQKAKSQREQRAIAEKIKEGIYNGLSGCGFTKLSVETIRVKRNTPQDSYTIFKSTYIIYAIYVTIMW